MQSKRYRSSVHLCMYSGAPVPLGLSCAIYEAEMHMSRAVLISVRYAICGCTLLYVGVYEPSNSLKIPYHFNAAYYQCAANIYSTSYHAHQNRVEGRTCPPSQTTLIPKYLPLRVAVACCALFAGLYAQLQIKKMHR